MTLIDSHCHLESFARNGSLDTVLERAAAAGVAEMICVGTEVEDWSLYRDLTRTHPGHLHYTVGLHPCNVDEGWQDALACLSPWFADATLPVALGEIGLDNFHLPKDAEQIAVVQKRQLEAFRTQLGIAAQFDVPVVIHARKAFAECVREIDASGVDWRRVVFHCFSEGPEEVRELNRRGGRASFTGVLTYPGAASVREAALAQGLDKLMVETDSPYLAPQPVRGKPNEPAHVRFTAETAAKLFGVTLDALADTATANTRAFFSLPSA
ncbi:MAG: TatD family hydrolase [Puniceicoccales bacterium]|jgi:TatD DNase family protein|nr:TatD family hydrolase [Puniceicoccales bacterium]